MLQDCPFRVSRWETSGRSCSEARAGRLAGRPAGVWKRHGTLRKGADWHRGRARSREQLCLHECTLDFCAAGGTAGWVAPCPGVVTLCSCRSLVPPDVWGLSAGEPAVCVPLLALAALSGKVVAAHTARDSAGRSGARAPRLRSVAGLLGSKVCHPSIRALAWS